MASTFGPDEFSGLYGTAPRSIPGDRPWVLANMVVGVDGAAAIDGRVGSLSDELDHQLLQYLRRLGDVLLVGARTVRAEGYGLVSGTRPAIVTGSGDLDYDSSLFAEASEPPLLLVPRSRAVEIGERAAGRAQVVASGSDRVDLGEALGSLREMGVGIVTTEGGPTLLRQLVSVGALDELCLTVSATIGGDDFGLFGDGPLPSRHLRLEHAATSHDSVYLRYLLT